MEHTIAVRFFAGVRETTGEIDTTVASDGPTTVADVLRRLGERYGQQFAALTIGPEGVGDGVIAMVNGQNVRLGRGGRTELKDGDELSLFSLIAGG